MVNMFQAHYLKVFIGFSIRRLNNGIILTLALIAKLVVQASGNTTSMSIPLLLCHVMRIARSH